MKLFPFQEEAVEKQLSFLMNSPSKGVYNACEAGLGKTIQTIAILNKQAVYKVLIICPAVMRLVWLEELKRHYFDISRSEILVVSSKKDLAYLRQSTNIIVISYALAAKYSEFLRDSFKPEYIVCDEAHALKNPGTKQTKRILENLAPNATYRIFLSGTPCTRGVVDIYPVAKFLSPNAPEFKSFYHFAGRYSFKRETPYGIKYYGLKNGPELSALIRTLFFIRYTKEEVKLELPEKSFQRIPLPIKYAVTLQQGVIADVKRVKAAIEGQGNTVPASLFSGALAGALQAQGLLKVDAVVELAETLLPGEPLVIFCWHKKVVEDLKNRLTEFNPICITGETPDNERKEAIDGFQAGRTNLIICNMQAGGVGITLTRASYCIFAELSWSPHHISQAVDRLHRIGQQRPVTAYYFCAEGDTVDELLVETIISKARDIGKVIENETKT